MIEMTEEEKIARHEELMDELFWITFFSKNFSADRVEQIVNEMEELFPTPEDEYPDQNKFLDFIFSGRIGPYT